MKVALVLLIAVLAIAPDQSEAFFGRWRKVWKAVWRGYKRIEPCLKKRGISLERMDLDKDGFLDRSELEQTMDKREALDLLESLDEDGDGKVTVADLEAVNERMLRLSEGDLHDIDGQLVMPSDVESS